MSSLELTVGGVNPKDAGRGIARIDQEAMRELSIVSGDVVRITGERQTVVKVWPGYSQDSGKGVIRIDGEVRKSAGVGIDDHVQVERVETEEATEVKVSLPQNIQIRGNLGAYLKDQLKDRPVTKGQVVAVSMGLGGIKKNKIPLRIAETKPSDPVVVGEQTSITVTEMSPEEVKAEGGEERDTPDVTYEDIGGLHDELEQVREMIELPMRHPELFEQLGIEPPKGVLLHGPPGTGKTLIAKAVANEIDAYFETISGPEIMSKYYGESEEKLREVFEEAEENAPAVIFIDELDSIAPARDEVSGEVERRVVAQLLSLMDGLESRGDVIVIAATNRVDAVDTALRRGGRFDREIEIGVPSREGRDEIFQIHTRGMPLADDVNVETLAEETYGFVGADIEALTKEAAMSALRRVRHDIDIEQEEIPAEVLEELDVDQQDFDEAMKTVEPSAMREVFVEVPDVSYEDVGGLDEVEQTLVEAVEWPLEHGDVYEAVGAEAPKGILLYGPPGTGKTLLAKAVANASNSNFISVKGPELLNKYVGESEKGVREVFQKARQNAPTVIFFDEIDAIAPERGGSMDSQVTERVVSQLLTELDGVEELKDVRVIAATNRPDMIDTALLRPGRLDKSIQVPLPEFEARKKIFDIHTRDASLAEEVDFDELAEMSEDYTGSDIEAVCREAIMSSVRELLTSDVDEDEIEKGVENVVVTMEDFEDAFDEVSKSLDEDDIDRYKQMAEDLGEETDDGDEGDKTFR
ncbi:MAG: CDC48 family AAA ATPase [Halobacteria archaeon]